MGKVIDQKMIFDNIYINESKNEKKYYKKQQINMCIIKNKINMIIK